MKSLAAQATSQLRDRMLKTASGTMVAFDALHVREVLETFAQEVREAALREAAQIARERERRHHEVGRVLKSDKQLHDLSLDRAYAVHCVAEAIEQRARCSCHLRAEARAPEPPRDLSAFLATHQRLEAALREIATLREALAKAVANIPRDVWEKVDMSVREEWIAALRDQEKGAK